RERFWAAGYHGGGRRRGPTPTRRFLMSDATTYSPNSHDLFKEPARRWLRAGYLLDHGRQPQSQDDDLTRQAWGFRRALTLCRTDADRDQLARDYPGLAEVPAVYTGEQRWELEARLLGGDASESIAARCGVSVQGVEAYHNTFYEVRPHLHADTYVNTV